MPRVCFCTLGLILIPLAVCSAPLQDQFAVSQAQPCIVNKVRITKISDSKDGA